MTTESAPVVLISIPHYKPGWKFGGPTRTISNLVDHLGDEFQFRIVTSDRDLGDVEAFPGVEVDRWQQVDRAQVYYMSPKKQSLSSFSAILGETDYDILYLNSFFHPTFTIKLLLVYWLRLARRRPVILAPRGEFSQSALKLKRVKKAIFIWSARKFGLYSGIRWQASSALEAADIEHAMASTATDIAIAANLPAPIDHLRMSTRSPTENESPLRVVLLSRLARMKNVTFALEVVRGSKIPILFDIWGTIDDSEYWRECEMLGENMPQHVKVSYRGSVKHDRVLETLAAYDLMLLPSLGENFGHVIAESLSVGTPVLISDRTPWRELKEAGVGWDLSIDCGPKNFREALAEARACRDTDGPAWRERVAKFAMRTLHQSDILDTNRQLFDLRSSRKG